MPQARSDCAESPSSMPNSKAKIFNGIAAQTTNAVSRPRRPIRSAWTIPHVREECKVQWTNPRQDLIQMFAFDLFPGEGGHAPSRLEYGTSTSLLQSGYIR
ncbi:hypothetical protein N7466_009035 [Penicillium verhagenii]|uniref:uncharacterized protein n=1 Tax=Penicillium verhagenii TaxID=1562060 RepID=UPI00254539F8|nr:uncharacterized protein N7466_009035 [Penicillium verhagenii]KAJ5924848.1 hypothetical protein N7466_009035 [Penicillium verhagenii]